MTQRDLQDIFESEFNWDNWKRVMNFVFPEFQFALTQQLVPLDNDLRKRYAHQIKQHGSGELADKEKIVLFEVLLKESVRLDRNVKSVRKLISNEIFKGYQIGLGVFHAEDKTKWRFTLVVREFSDALTVVEKRPESYTYVLGKNEKGRTAAKRFFDLAKKPNKGLSDLEEAFSVEALSDDFFNRYKEVYREFETDIINNPSRLSLFKVQDREKAARDFVKRMMGRIIFLYFLQKRGWMGCKVKWENGDEKFMKHFFEAAEENELFYHTYLRPLFFDTLNEKRQKIDEDCIINKKNFGKVPYLNGGLFEKEENHPEGLTLSYSIFKKFFEILEAYNFTIIEDDPSFREVAVDPEMLGHIFENLLEDNKEKGVFYTPKEIVQYMCRETLIEYLYTKLSNKISNATTLKDALRLFVLVQHFSQLNDLDQRIDEYIIKALKEVKVCDPAIGSGAFPMGILHEMFRLIEFFEDRDSLYSIWGIDKWDAARFKESIIQNSIYGVDIEKGAVDIARLRFWLSIVIDEQEPKPLPNLDYKIMQGNSLLECFENINLKFDKSKYNKPIEKQTDLFGTVAEKDKQISIAEAMASSNFDLMKLEKEFFGAQSTAHKESIRNQITAFEKKFIDDQIEEQEKIILTNINTLTRKLRASNYDRLSKKKNDEKAIENAGELLVTVQKAKKNALKIKEGTKPYFLWHLYFMNIFDEGGFDIIIGNPPYIQLQKMGKDCDALEKVKYETFERTGDIYCLFYELGFNLLKANGILTFITSNKWMRAAYGESLRKYFVKNTNPLTLVDFGGFQVFETATVDTNILLSQKAEFKNRVNTCVLGKNFSLNKMSDYFMQNQSITTFSDDQSWVVLSSIEKGIKTKIENVGTPLREWDIDIYRGILTGYNDAFIIDNSTKERLIAESPKSAEIIRPIFRGRDIKRYNAEFASQYLICTHNGVKEKNIEKVDVVNEYPAIYDHLKKYQQDLEARLDKGDHWTNLRNCAYLDDLDKEKIIWIELTDHPNFYLDTQGYYINNTVFFITGERLSYLLSFLNSKLCEWYFTKIAATSGAGTRRWIKIYIEQIRIPQSIPKGTEELLVFLTNEIQRLKKVGIDTIDMEEKVDLEIFNLFDLSNDEIEYVRNSLISK